jgi:hypothetical protein
MQPIEWLISHNLPTWASDRAILRFIFDRIKMAEQKHNKRYTRDERRELYTIALYYQRKTRKLFADMRL